eukprot:jgi/Botrbrau1/13391/Bobra.0194s0022.2
MNEDLIGNSQEVQNLADDHSKWVVSGTGVHPVEDPETGPHGRKYRSPSSSRSTAPARLLNRRRLKTLDAGAASPSHSNSGGSPQHESTGGLAEGGAGGLMLPLVGPKAAPMGAARAVTGGMAGPLSEPQAVKKGAGGPAVDEEVNGSAQVVWFGDVNRAESQLYRGGGAICFANRELWTIFDGIVAELLDCGEMP